MSRAPTVAEVATAIDAVVARPVLVVGSPPPTGRDLDLLARANEHHAVTEWLAEAGFVPWRHAWLRLEEGARSVVDLSTTSPWRTGGAGEDRLFEGAERIPGYERLLRPDPGTVLLLAARGTVTRRGRLTAKVRRRVTDALERDPDAWNVAERRGGPLGMRGALRLLRSAHLADGTLSPLARSAGLAGVWLGGGPLRARTRVLMDLRPRQWRPAVVSFSGLDGSGKSTQVRELHRALERAGVQTEVQWAGFKTGAMIRKAVPVLDRVPVSSGKEPGRPVRGTSRDPLVPAACLAYPAGRQLWMHVVVGLNVISLWRYVLIPRRGTKVLIFDRFSPDTGVKLDFHYAVNRRFDVRRQRDAFTALSPKPDVGFLVAVPPEVAYSRRQDQTLDELRAMARLYEQQVPRFGLVRLDGTGSAGALANQVFAAAWRGLP